MSDPYYCAETGSLVQLWFLERSRWAPKRLIVQCWSNDLDFLFRFAKTLPEMHGWLWIESADYLLAARHIV